MLNSIIHNVSKQRFTIYCRTELKMSKINAIRRTLMKLVTVKHQTVYSSVCNTYRLSRCDYRALLMVINVEMRHISPQLSGFP